MRVNYVTRDESKTASPLGNVYAVWLRKPAFDDGAWWEDNGNVDADEDTVRDVTPAEAKKLIGKALKPGQIWDRRRNTIR